MTKVKIICKKHKIIFEQTPTTHFNKGGCPICRQSKGEQTIMNFLLEHNIGFKTQYKFAKCKRKKQLPFDFYLPNLNICIEYNGRQHYMSLNHFGGEEEFNLVKIRDNIKKEYCKNNDIRLVIIKFDQDIETRLIEEGIIEKKEVV